MVYQLGIFHGALCHSVMHLLHQINSGNFSTSSMCRGQVKVIHGYDCLLLSGSQVKQKQTSLCRREKSHCGFKYLATSQRNHMSVKVTQEVPTHTSGRDLGGQHPSSCQTQDLDGQPFIFEDPSDYVLNSVKAVLTNAFQLPCQDVLCKHIISGLQVAPKA